MDKPRSVRRILADVLRDPACVAELRAADWDILIRQGRAANLLARLAHLLAERGLLSSVPQRPRAHLIAARILADKHARDVRWEVRCLRMALARVGVPFVLLKGAAYLFADLPPARGRVFNDIDIMVAKPALGEVERALRIGGWVSANSDPYDQKYYRTWMHQIPPMRHFARQSVIDVHHTIVPETARWRVPGQKLQAASLALSEWPELHVLAPADMVLHSATHLFNDGEFTSGLRDLCDIVDLLRHFGQAEDFWRNLDQRARELDLECPLGHALYHGQRRLGLVVPAALATRLGPRSAAQRLLEATMVRALRPDHPSCDDAFTGVARWFLYARGHSLRMPLRLLLPHLARKAFKGRPAAA